MSTEGPCEIQLLGLGKSRISQIFWLFLFQYCDLAKGFFWIISFLSAIVQIYRFKGVISWFKNYITLMCNSEVEHAASSFCCFWIWPSMTMFYYFEGHATTMKCGERAWCVLSVKQQFLFTMLVFWFAWWLHLIPFLYTCCIVHYLLVHTLKLLCIN